MMTKHDPITDPNNGDESIDCPNVSQAVELFVL